jgi:subtilisin family serine protease
MSSDSTLSNAVMSAINAGMIFVAATGNNGGTNAILFPARMDPVIAVGATETNDERASFSNFGPEIDLVAPGTNIFSISRTNGLVLAQGTSFATPHVAGVCALLAGLITNLTQDQARTLLCAGADDEVGDPSEDTPGYDDYHGWGRLNAWATLQLAQTRALAIQVTNRVSLQWSAPSNASNRHPFRVEHASTITSAWTLAEDGTNVTYAGTNALWSGTTTEGFYRVVIGTD